VTVIAKETETVIAIATIDADKQFKKKKKSTFFFFLVQLQQPRQFSCKL